MTGIRLFEQWIKEGLGWWAGLARVEIEFDIESQLLKIAAVCTGLEVMFTWCLSRTEMLCESNDLPRLYVGVGKTMALMANDYSNKNFGYAPNKAR